jgi:PEP-CTERM motif-containing protein
MRHTTFRKKPGWTQFVFALVLAIMALGGRTAFAIPTLQLDIEGGVYDNTPGVETIFTTTHNDFTLYAVGTPGSVSASEILNTQYYLSAAFFPKVAQSAGFDGGTFVIDGTTYTLNSSDPNVNYGTPPLLATSNPLLGGHGVFETYYVEIPFTFSLADQSTAYNSQDDAGGISLGGLDPSGTGAYFVPFTVNLDGLVDLTGMHFDIYSTKLKKNGEITRDDFAPFSHDAEGRPNPPPGGPPPPVDVPEPATLGIFGLGLIGLGWINRRRRRAG